MAEIQTSMNNINILSNERENYEKEMQEKCNEIAEYFFKFKNRFHMSDIILQSNYKVDENGNKILNNNFDNIELIEENLDEVMYAYNIIKTKIADARKVYLTIEKIDKSVTN